MASPLEVVLQGDSMWPTFRNGDVLFFQPLGDDDILAAGDVVLAQHPLKGSVLIVKRVHRVLPTGEVFLVGDQTDPTATEDSHNFGPVGHASVMGRWNGEVKRA
jgi:nickel-type superoxide dismutase maturation protease